MHQQEVILKITPNPKYETTQTFNVLTPEGAFDVEDLYQFLAVRDDMPCLSYELVQGWCTTGLTTADIVDFGYAMRKCYRISYVTVWLNGQFKTFTNDHDERIHAFVDCLKRLKLKNETLPLTTVFWSCRLPTRWNRKKK